MANVSSVSLFQQQSITTDSLVVSSPETQFGTQLAEKVSALAARIPETRRANEAEGDFQSRIESYLAVLNPHTQGMKDTDQTLLLQKSLLFPLEVLSKLMQNLDAAGAAKSLYVYVVFVALLDILPERRERIIDQLPRLKGFSDYLIKQVIILLGGYEQHQVSGVVDDLIARKNDPQLSQEIHTRLQKRPLGDNRTFLGFHSSIKFQEVSTMLNAVEKIRWKELGDQLNLVQEKGLLGVKVVENKFVVCSWFEWVTNHFKSIAGFYESTLGCQLAVIKSEVKEIQGLESQTDANSPHLKDYFGARKTLALWNQFVGKDSLLKRSLAEDERSTLIVSHRELLPIQIENTAFPSKRFDFFITNGESLPLIIQPKENWDLETFKTHLSTHQQEVKALVDQTGAILFRGFPIHTPEDFRGVLTATMGKSPSNYVGEGLRGKKKSDAVFPSTDAPKSFSIPLHSERLFTHTPSYISFFCLTPPDRETGQTTLGRAAEINNALREKGVWDYFAVKAKDGVKIDQMMTYPSPGTFYTKVNPAHKNWQQVFGKETKEEVIQVLEQNNITFNKERFLKAGTLEVHEYAPLFRNDPRSSDGSLLWESLVHQFHHNARKHGGWFIHLLVNILYPFQNLRAFDAQFTDGSEISQDRIYQLYDALQENTLATTDWLKGDMTIVNNLDVWHGRAPSAGSREILAAVIL